VHLRNALLRVCAITIASSPNLDGYRLSHCLSLAGSGAHEAAQVDGGHVVHALTRGGPGKATETLILLAVVPTTIQFRFLERRVHYA